VIIISELHSIYYETIENPTSDQWLLLMHPIMGSMRSWKNLGYVRRFEKDYNILLIDALGHGNSIKEQNYFEYKLEIASIKYLQILKQLNLKNLFAIGYSLGGWNLLGMIREQPNLFSKVAIGGAHPLARNITDLNAMIELYSKPVDDIIEHFNAHSQMRKDEIKKNHFPSLVQTLKAMREFKGFTKSDFEKITMPVLVYAGAKDYLYNKIKESVNFFPFPEFVTLFDMEHNDPMIKVTKSYPILEEFFKLE
jgi:pimeloyl-ACP methyl ester carboxylesterase